MLLKYLPLSVLFALLLTACSSESPEEVNTQHLERAKAYQDQGQYKAAIIEYRNAVKKSGGATSSILPFADMLNKLGRYGSAIDLLQQAEDKALEAYTLELVESYIGLKKYQSAEASLQSLKGRPVAGQILEAQVAAGRGAPEDAEALFKAVIGNAKATPSQVSEARLGLAMSRARQSSFDDALAQIDQVPLNDAKYAEAQALKAGIQIVNLDLPAAEATLSDALSRMRNTDIMEPQRAAILERLAYVLTRLGRSNEAYIYQKLLAEAFPGANEVAENYQESLKAFQAKDFNQAKVILQKILAEYPTHNKAKQLLGVISYLQGDTQQASEYLDESVDPEVVDPLTRHIYAATSLKLNDPKKVLEILEPQIEQSDSASTLALYGLAAISDGQGVKGEAALKRAASISPDDVRIRLALASYYRKLTPPKLEEEFEQLNEAYKLAPVDRQVLTDMVAYHYRNSGAERAGKFIKAALKKNPDAYATNLVAGYFEISARQLDAALKHFDKALQAKSEVSDYSEALYAKGRTEFSLDKINEAAKTFSLLVKNDPGNEDGYQALYSIYARQGSEEEAALKLESLAKRNAVAEPYLVLIKRSLLKGETERSEYYYGEAKAHSRDELGLKDINRAIRYTKATEAMRQGQLQEARTLASGLLSEQPESIRLLSFLVDIELRDGQYSEAEKVLQQLEALDSTHPVVSVLKGDLAMGQQDLSAARRFYEQSWKANPGNAIADKLLAVLTLLKDDSARQLLIDDWQEKIPSSVKPLLLQAIRFQERGQKIKALDSYEAVLALQPENVAALNNLGWLLFEKGEREKSETMLRKAAGLAPENAAVLDSLGWVLFKHGQVKEGIRYLEKANKIAPENKEISAHLSEAKKSG